MFFYKKAFSNITTKNCRLKQNIKIRSIQKESYDKDNDEKKGFVKGLKQAWYNEPLYIIYP